jgi:ABC-type dipeptide/oligopeptide/nickel transport system permease subunit
MAGAALIESGVSCLGRGVRPPAPRWGTTRVNGRSRGNTAWGSTTLPNAALFATDASTTPTPDKPRDVLHRRRR